MLGVPVRRRRQSRPATSSPSAPSASGTARSPASPVGQLYGFRVDGPWDPAHGRRFNPAKLLLDPYARAITGDAVAGPADALPSTTTIR